jgi:predicted dehydrogenase
MSQSITRREFLKAGVALSALPLASMVHAQGSDRIKVGLVGCGGRGTGAAIDCLRADEGTVIWAMGDIFEDRLNTSYEGLKEQFPDRVQVPPERRFLGFDAYKKVLESGIDLVLLCTPPAFRPIHFLAAVEAGKHVFMEKPVAVCPEGVRMMLRGDEIARQKRLGVMPGTQYRWHPGYQGVIERIRAGHIGEIRAAYAYYNAASPAPRPREAGWSDMVYQLRNWLFYTWLSGDQPVEQFVHNIDVMNWVMGSVPVRAMAMGGRQARTAPEYGDVYDHFAIEYEYPNGVRVLAMCRPDGQHRLSRLQLGGRRGRASPDGAVHQLLCAWQGDLGARQAVAEPLCGRASRADSEHSQGRPHQRDAHDCRKHADGDYGAHVGIHGQNRDLGGGVELQAELCGARDKHRLRQPRAARPCTDTRQDAADIGGTLSACWALGLG